MHLAATRHIPATAASSAAPIRRIYNTIVAKPGGQAGREAGTARSYHTLPSEGQADRLSRRRRDGGRPQQWEGLELKPRGEAVSPAEKKGPDDLGGEAEDGGQDRGREGRSRGSAHRCAGSRLMVDSGNETRWRVSCRYLRTCVDDSLWERGEETTKLGTYIESPACFLAVFYTSDLENASTQHRWFGLICNRRVEKPFNLFVLLLSNRATLAPFVRRQLSVSTSRSCMCLPLSRLGACLALRLVHGGGPFTCFLAICAAPNEPRW